MDGSKIEPQEPEPEPEEPPPANLMEKLDRMLLPSGLAPDAQVPEQRPWFGPRSLTPDGASGPPSPSGRRDDDSSPTSAYRSKSKSLLVLAFPLSLEHRTREYAQRMAEEEERQRELTEATQLQAERSARALGVQAEPSLAEGMAGGSGSHRGSRRHVQITAEQARDIGQEH